MVIRVIDLIGAADTEADGSAVYARLHTALSNSDNAIVLSFTGVHTATSSFVNAAFVPLLRDVTYSDLKRRLRVIDSSRQINDMIRSRLEREALVAA